MIPFQTRRLKAALAVCVLVLPRAHDQVLSTVSVAAGQDATGRRSSWTSSLESGALSQGHAGAAAASASGAAEAGDLGRDASLTSTHKAHQPRTQHNTYNSHVRHSIANSQAHLGHVRNPKQNFGGAAERGQNKHTRSQHQQQQAHNSPRRLATQTVTQSYAKNSAQQPVSQHQDASISILAALPSSTQFHAETTDHSFEHAAIVGKYFFAASGVCCGVLGVSWWMLWVLYAGVIAELNAEVGAAWVKKLGG